MKIGRDVGKVEYAADLIVSKGSFCCSIGCRVLFPHVNDERCGVDRVDWLVWLSFYCGLILFVSS